MILTIGIPVYGAVDFLRKCLISIERNTVVEYEVLVVNDGNSKAVEAEIVSAVEDTCKSAVKARIAHVKMNSGFPYACNVIFDFAESSNICILNSDTYVTRGWDVTLLDALKQDDVGMSGPTLTSCTTTQATMCNPGGGMSNEEFEVYAERYARNSSDSVREVGVLHGSCMMIKRELKSSVGYFDERFGLGYAEEYDYCKRVIAKGMKLIYVPKAFVHHFGKQSFGKLTINTHELRKRNIELLRGKTAGEVAGEIVTDKDNVKMELVNV